MARGLGDEAVGRSLGTIRRLEAFAASPGGNLSGARIADVERFVADRMVAGDDPEDSIISMARYFAVIGENEIATRLLSYVLPVGVLPTMVGRLSSIEGEKTCGAVMADISVPAPGSPPESYPKATAAFVEAMKSSIGEERSKRVLTCNVHGIPAQSLLPERKRLEAAGSIDAWLVDYHARQVLILDAHARDGTLWFEQTITPEVVSFVRDSPEILGGVKEGDVIYATKIPYDPARYLKATDPVEKRRLACHCPLAASSIHDEGAGVPALWCSCSAGYEKFLFDVVLGAETEATVLSSALAGDELCRFAIKIPRSARYS